MPAERSKQPKRGGADGNLLVWTIPVESDGASFTSAATQVTFDDGPPPLVDITPSESILFPPVEGSSPRRPGHGKKKPEDHIPRPPNAFILFRSSFIKSHHVPSEVETNHSTLSKIIGLTWKNLPDDERQFWHAKAKLALDEHKRKFPQYAFRPAQGRNKGGTEKRKVREVGPKDHVRCAKIAELLVEGKKGHELDAAVQEFDKHHVPEVVTRFEAPITARMYRRSSSVPIPDAIDSERPLRKARSSSTQPSEQPNPKPVPEAKQEPQPEEVPLPTIDHCSFPVQALPSFDFNAFSFDNHTSPVDILPCDPLTEQASGPVSPFATGDLLFTIPENMISAAAPQLSIDTSFLDLDHWARSSSPLSTPDSSVPATPSFSGSPTPDSYVPYSLQSFEPSLAKSFGDLSSQYGVYPSPCDAPFAGVYADSSSAFHPFEEHQSKIHMAHQDFAFSAFMTSLPEYTHTL